MSSKPLFDSDYSWDEEHFPLDLSEDVRIATQLFKPQIPTAWDVPSPVHRSCLLSGWEKWHDMLYKHCSSLSHPSNQTSSSSSSSKSPYGSQFLPAWEIPTSKGEGLGYYKGVKLETPVIVPSIVHSDFVYPKAQNIIRSRLIKPYYPFSHNLSPE